jgi:hypothetical protein
MPSPGCAHHLIVQPMEHLGCKSAGNTMGPLSPWHHDQKMRLCHRTAHFFSFSSVPFVRRKENRNDAQESFFFWLRKRGHNGTKVIDHN